MKNESKKRLLVIDDSPTALLLLKTLLEEEGREVETAETGEEGVAKAHAQQFDGVIIDTVLPGIDGFEACRQIRAKVPAEAAKIIMTTGFVDAVDAVKARKAGADEYMVKTSDFSYLLKVISRVIGKE